MFKLKRLKLNLKPNINNALILTGAVAFIFVVGFFVWWQKGGGIEINKDTEAELIKDNQPLSKITGIPCEETNRRPVAIMLASDPVARPLSGINQADIVFEMPVTPGGVTRMMAIFQCESPKEIGSVRSAREDFIPLAAGLGAVFVHWGGEHEALTQLNSHIIDNVDALKYETKYFYRKSGVRQPHNGFTALEMIWSGVKDFKYSTDNSFSGYPHKEGESIKNITNIVDEISIDYPSPYDIVWKYNQNTNTYKRTRGQSQETDKNDGSQAEVSVVITMRANPKPKNIDYMGLEVTGEGEASIYQNGAKISGNWKKDSSRLDNKLFFYDNDGKEIEFVPGKIWVEVTID